jgi:hypothetical protein
VAVAMIGVMIPSAFGQYQEVPSWVKNNAGWWAEGTIPDETFVQGIEYLVETNILIVSSNLHSATTQQENIPSWIKNNAGWWATGNIDDKTFVQGIEWLISNGLIIIEHKINQENSELSNVLVQDYDLIGFFGGDEITTQDWSDNLYDGKKLKIISDYDDLIKLRDILNGEKDLIDNTVCEWGIVLSHNTHVVEEKETCFQIGGYERVFVKISEFVDSQDSNKLMNKSPSEIKYVYKKYVNFSKNTSCIWQFEDADESWQNRVAEHNYLVLHPELIPVEYRSYYSELRDDTTLVGTVNEWDTNSDVVMCKHKNYVLTLVSAGLWREEQFMLMDKMIENLLLLDGGKPTFTTDILLEQQNVIKYEMPLGTTITGFVLFCGESQTNVVDVVVSLQHDDFEKKDRKLSGVIKLKLNNYLDQVLASDTVTFNNLSYMEDVLLEKGLTSMTAHDVKYCSYEIVSIR